VTHVPPSFGALLLFTGSHSRITNTKVKVDKLFCPAAWQSSPPPATSELQFAALLISSRRPFGPGPASEFEEPASRQDLSPLGSKQQDRAEVPRRGTRDVGQVTPYFGHGLRPHLPPAVPVPSGPWSTASSLIIRLPLENESRAKVWDRAACRCTQGGPRWLASLHTLARPPPQNGLTRNPHQPPSDWACTRQLCYLASATNRPQEPADSMDW